MPRKYGTKFVNISKSNNKTILDYQKYRESRVSENTVRNEYFTLRKLAHFLNKTDFKDATRKQMEDFFSDTDNVSTKSRDLYASNILKFYQWLLQLKRKQRPPCMESYEYRTSAEKDRDKDPNPREKYNIEIEDYKKLLDCSLNIQEKALWETMYLSGARPSEILSMKINSKIELENGYAIRIYSSKTKKRDIPLSEPPVHLLSWIRNHPFKDDPEHALWLSMSPAKMFNPMTVDSLLTKFIRAGTRAGIKISPADGKTTLRPHSFRKTRATIMFKEGYTDTEMAKFFGWKIRSVSSRREQYDLTDQEYLNKKVIGNGIKEKSYETLLVEKEKLETRHKKEIESLKKQINAMNEEIQKITSTLLKKPEV
jgi:integrase